MSTRKFILAMKLVLLLVSSLVTFSNSYQVIHVTYTVTHKVQYTFDSVKNAEHDPWVDSIMLDMISKTRIIHEFDLRSAQSETYISQYRLKNSGQIQISGTIGPYIYKTDYWFADNLLENPAMYTVRFEETAEKKTILGYECTKFLCTRNTADSMRMQIWASRRLPSYINPVYRLTGFPYGILEVVSGDSTEVIQAKSMSVKEGKKKKIRTETM